MSENPDTWRGARFGEYVDPPAAKPKVRVRVSKSTAKALALPSELESSLEDLERWKATLAEAKKDERLRSEILEAMGATRDATCGQYRLLAKLHHRKAYRVDAGIYLTLEVSREA